MLEGIPWIAPLVGVLLVIWTFVQNRTAFGRHVYAVGGNAEAARRAGIRVGYITIACFVISSAMAVISGIAAASRLSSVDPVRRRRQHPALRGRRRRHRWHVAVRRQGQGPGRDHRWSGHRRHRQRPRPARAAGLHQVHHHRHRAAARCQRRRAEPPPPRQRRSLTAPSSGRAGRRCGTTGLARRSAGTPTPEPRKARQCQSPFGPRVDRHRPIRQRCAGSTSHC